MFIIYITGDDFGHLDDFYFSLILITFFDGFTNAFAFGINAAYSSMLSAGIPTSGALVSLLHNLYKFFSDSFHWDNFDYHVLRLQLLINIITILFTLILWSVDTSNQTGGAHKPASLLFLFGYKTNASGGLQDAGDDNHLLDWSPIGMLAISLGTVYAFYPSIAPYSIIDFQYASVIELSILIISAIPPLLIAVLDFNDNGPSGKKSTSDITLITSLSSTQVTVPSTNNLVDFTTPPQKITLTSIKVTHYKKDGDANVTNIIHPKGSGTACTSGTSHNGSVAKFHPYDTSGSTTEVSYTLQSGDKYHPGGASNETSISSFTLKDDSIRSINYKVYYNWFYTSTKYVSTIAITGQAGTKIEFTGGTNPIPYTDVKFSIPADDGTNVQWNTSADNETKRWGWNCVWLCAIFYILCIQIFMSMLHYPHCLLSCFFNDHPYYIGFISILFNTLRETMQACGFSGAGKQCINLVNNGTQITGKLIFNDVTLTAGKVTSENLGQSDTDKLKIGNKSHVTKYLTGTYDDQGQTRNLTFNEIQATAKVKLPITTSATATLKIGGAAFNTTISATNKLITLFVMMFCVFTGDGYLQHYRSCCRDCWPTTGFNKYQSFFYWLRCGFKGGSKSFTTALLLQ